MTCGKIITEKYNLINNQIGPNGNILPNKGEQIILSNTLTNSIQAISES